MKTKQLLISGLILLSFLFTITNVSAQCTELVFEDNFDGSSVDQSKWIFENGNGCDFGICGWGNAELQYYQPNNSTVENRVLKITAKNETVEGSTYTSSKLVTNGTYNFKYGRIESRLKLPSAKNVWPAFWLLPEVSTWPSTGEIDIMESSHKNPDHIGGTIHYFFGAHQYSGASFYSDVYPDLSADFHTYAIEWEPNEIRWYVDDILFQTQNISTTVGGAWPFNEGNWYLILNVAVGGSGTWYTGIGENPDPADYPATMEVDYVRVYKGAYNYGISGATTVFENDVEKVYAIEEISGATYDWSVPAGATISAGQGTNQITVDWGTTAGTIALEVTNNCQSTTYETEVSMEAPLVPEYVFEDFEGNRNVDYAYVQGTFNQSAVNPNNSLVNNSAVVADYQRDGGSQYDVIQMENVIIENANDFVLGKKKFQVSVYTTAPIGTQVILQMEDINSATSENYPTGRHSSYLAYTTRQNGWETLTFEFNQSMDGAMSIFDINSLTLLFNANSNTDDTYFWDNLLMAAVPGTDHPVVQEVVLENYEGESSLTKGLATGVYTETSNPAVNEVNGSANVVRYERNAEETYDVLFFSTPSISNAGQFKSEVKKVFIDVYTDAPVGTIITMNMENSETSLATNYPTGRNSTYAAKTTVQNSWETLEFRYSSTPDAGTSNLLIDQLVFLFNSNSNTSDTYYIDNIRVGSSLYDPVYEDQHIYDDYEVNRNQSFASASGVYVDQVANPSIGGVNTSSTVAEYIRSIEDQYDVLFIDNTLIEDGGVFVDEELIFAMDLYTTAPVGTVISWQLEDSDIATSSNFPTGRHSTYQALTTATNEWQTLYFSFVGQPSSSTSDFGLDQIVLLFDPNALTNDTYYIDNMRVVKDVANEEEEEEEGETPTGFILPTLFEAEDYDAMEGVQTQATADVGGGLNVGWINVGDYMEYAVYVPESKSYQIEYRVASIRTTGAFNLEADGVVVGTYTVPNTSGWQNWVTITDTVDLVKGNQNFKIDVTGSGFNINWMEVSELGEGEGPEVPETGDGCEALANNGQFTASMSGDQTNPVISFTPETSIAGSDMCILYYSVNGADKGGHFMTLNADGIFDFQINAVAGDEVEVYFTYRMQAGAGPENNSAGDRKTFVVGDCGGNARYSTSLVIETIQNISVYPSPAQYQISISGIEGAQVYEIYNISGIKVLSGTTTAKASVNINGLRGGVYFVRLAKGNTVNTLRFVKK